MVLLPCWKGDSSGWWRLDANPAGWRQRSIQCWHLFWSQRWPVHCMCSEMALWYEFNHTEHDNKTCQHQNDKQFLSRFAPPGLLRWHHKRCCWCDEKVSSPPLQRTIATFRTQLLLFSALSLCWRWHHLAYIWHKSLVFKESSLSWWSDSERQKFGQQLVTKLHLWIATSSYIMQHNMVHENVFLF